MKKSLVLVLGLLLLGCRAPMISEETTVEPEGEVVENVPAVEVEVEGADGVEVEVEVE